MQANTAEFLARVRDVSQQAQFEVQQLGALIDALRAAGLEMEAGEKTLLAIAKRYELPLLQTSACPGILQTWINLDGAVEKMTTAALKRLASASRMYVQTAS